MALSQLIDEAYVSTANAAQNTINLLESKLMETTGESTAINAVIAKLESAIQQLQREEANILAAFGINPGENAEAELQAKFREFNNKSGLSNLTGPNIRKIFLEEYQISVDENMREMQSYIDNYIIPNMINFIDTTGAHDVGEELAKAFNASLKGLYVQCNLTNGTVHVTRSGKPVSTDKNNAIKVLASDLTKEQARRISQLRDHMKQHGAPTITGNTTINGNSVVSFFKSEWYDLTRVGGSTPLTETQIAKAIDNKVITQSQLDSINDRISDMICAQTNNPSLVKRYINKMLGQDQYIFFVGKNVNAITGILGEIAAVISISELLVNVDPDKIVNWVANHKIDNKKLSIDILLKGLGNFQVKNTAQDLVNIPLINVDFAKGNVDYILSKLEAGYNWDTDILRTVIESESFNEPVKYYGTSFHQTSLGTSYKNKIPPLWDGFVSAYNIMTDVIARVHNFLTGYAPDFLYMAAPTDFKHQLAVLDRSMDGFVGQGIHVYLVGGVPHLASTQLKIIQEDLRRLQEVKNAEQHFTIRTVFGSIVREGESIPYDYEAYKNGIKAKNAKITSAMAFKN